MIPGPSSEESKPKGTLRFHRVLDPWMMKLFSVPVEIGEIRRTMYYFYLTVLLVYFSFLIGAQ